MRLYNRLACVGSLLLAALLASCEKGRPEFGGQFINEAEKLSISQVATRAFSVSNDSVGYDPVVMFKQTSLGQVYDPTFGRSTGHFATEVFPSSLDDLKFTEESLLDSAFLDLYFAKSYGAEPLRIRVYQLKDTISRADERVMDERYAGGILIGETTIQPQERHARIRLPEGWSRDLILGAKGRIKDRNQFRVYFPGIYVQGVCDDGLAVGRMLTYYAADLRNGFSFHWREGGARHALRLEPTVASRRYSALTFDTKGAVLGNSLELRKEEQEKQSEFYLAGQGRAVGRVDFSALREQWADSIPLTLLRAELRIHPVASSLEYGDTLVVRLSSFFKEKGDYFRIPDQAVNVASYHGLYNHLKGYYSLNITMFIQQILAGEVPGNIMYLFADESSLGYGRVVLASPLHAEVPMTLVLTYTRL